MKIRYGLLSVIVLILSACGGSDDSAKETALTLAEEGGLVYMEPRENGNTFACVHCHALSEPSVDGFTRPGHPIGDALRRPSFKNGQLSEFIDAANICLTEWMNVPEPWATTSEDYLALTEFLDSQDDKSKEANAFSIQQVEPLVFSSNDEVDGDSSNGQQLFNTSCAICHGENATGTERAPQLRGLSGSENYIATRVRTSGNVNSAVYSGLTGGRMPFWSEDRVSNDDLEDIISFLTSDNIEDIIATNPETENQISGEGACATTHAKIGQVATFTTRQHDVAGTATIIDDCTIQIEGFKFDGGGIDVRFYGATNSRFDDGFSIGNNLVRSSEYNNESLTIRIPTGYDLDDLDRLSVWCIPIGLSFGDGVFQ